MNWLKAKWAALVAKVTGWWKNHGTKILGFLTSVYGFIQGALEQIKQVDPRHAAVWGLVVALGGFIIARGFTNSKP